MPKKGHYDGTKMRGNHTTILNGAEKVVKSLDKNPLVTGISLGVIRTSGAASNGKLRVKSALAEGVMVLKVVKSGSSQEIRVYSPRLGSVMRAVKKEFPE